MTNGKMCTYHFVYRNSNEIDRIYHIWYMYLQLIEPMYDGFIIIIIIIGMVVVVVVVVIRLTIPVMIIVL